MTRPDGIEHLGEALGAPDQVLPAGGEAGRLLADHGGEFVGARAEPGVDRGVDVVLELQVDEEAGRRPAPRRSPRRRRG